jgi:hypothetical protein
MRLRERAGGSALSAPASSPSSPPGHALPCRARLVIDWKWPSRCCCRSDAAGPMPAADPRRTMHRRQLALQHACLRGFGCPISACARWHPSIPEAHIIKTSPKKKAQLSRSQSVITPLINSPLAKPAFTFFVSLPLQSTPGGGNPRAHPTPISSIQLPNFTRSHLLGMPTRAPIVPTPRRFRLLRRHHPPWSSWPTVCSSSGARVATDGEKSRVLGQTAPPDGARPIEIRSA